MSVRPASDFLRSACVLAVLLPFAAEAAPAKKPAAPAASSKPVAGQAPVINHTPVGKVDIGSVATILVTMTDPQGVFEPKLYVRSAGKKAFVPFAFEKVDGDQYKVEVPPGAFSGGSFSYYIEAFDSDGNGPARVGTSARRPNRSR